jgi:hypothetical protein
MGLAIFAAVSLLLIAATDSWRAAALTVAALGAIFALAVTLRAWRDSL